MYIKQDKINTVFLAATFNKHHEICKSTLPGTKKKLKIKPTSLNRKTKEKSVNLMKPCRRRSVIVAVKNIALQWLRQMLLTSEFNLRRDCTPNENRTILLTSVISLIIFRFRAFAINPDKRGQFAFINDIKGKMMLRRLEKRFSVLSRAAKN